MRKLLGSDMASEIDQMHQQPKWPYIILAIVSAFIILFLIQGCAQAYTEQDTIKAVIGEAENQGLIGMEAVACSIHNRGSLKGVYGLTSNRVKKHLYSLKTALQAKQAVLQSQDAGFCAELVHGASFWEGTRFKTPYWARNMTITATIGQQRFYRP